jgi:hypothetical protein
VLLSFQRWLVPPVTQLMLQAKQLPSPRTCNHLHVILLQLKQLPIAAPHPAPTHLQAL